MKTVSIWWNDKRIKGTFYLCDLAPKLLEILEQHKAEKIEIKYLHASIETYTKSELLNQTATARRLDGEN